MFQVARLEVSIKSDLHPQAQNDRNIICGHKVKGPVVRYLCFALEFFFSSFFTTRSTARHPEEFKPYKGRVPLHQSTESWCE